MEECTDAARHCSFGSGYAAWPAGLPEQCLRFLPYDPRNHGGRQCGAGSHSYRQPHLDSSRNSAEHERQSRRLDRRPATHQARKPYGRPPHSFRRPAATRRLPGEPEVTPTIDTPDEMIDPRHGTNEEHRNRLLAAWSRPGGFFGWFTATTHTAIGMRYIVTAFIF